MSLVILRDPDVVLARLRTPSQEWVEACTGEAGTLFPVIDIEQAGYEGHGDAVGWVAEPAEIFAGHYDPDDEIPESCDCIGVYGGEYQMMEMPTGEISIYNPSGWDSASGMASAHEFASAGHAGAAVSLLAAIVRELDPLDALEDDEAREEALKAALQEIGTFVEALPHDLGGTHFWESATEGLVDHYDTW
ncbi:hypothetical protein GTY65_36440 [Streptomyces sp. SID8379]|uniref:hypothetical protein n=1 Tax=unclassified Streptomyces TaxID=2593676 RepID=UPI00035F899C|nr:MULTISPECIES: hypothetical protein [unclassified Streptomyces]MYW69517.1 hypothetical protein [Streptomyces sp. SID8379]